ncbi:MAG: hypothetical protein K8T10_14015 [Candidatus Eremiobacteraeota bacterium]|nr:hypothetical protein [Candidatus Eremiobacteraeota bacterium]
MRKFYLSTTLVLLLCCAFIIVGCSVSGEDSDSNAHIIAGAMYNATNGSYVFADVEKDGEWMENATITVNGTQLSYGLPLTYEGVSLGSIPIYYSDMNFNPGDSLTMNAKLSGEGSAFYEGTVIVPSALTLTKPTETQFIGNQEIDVAWNTTSNTMLYFLSFYSQLESYDNPYEITTLENSATIPASYTQPEEANLEVYAYNGSNIEDLFIDEGDETEDGEEDNTLDRSYWLASTYDYKDLTMTVVPCSTSEEGDSRVYFVSDDGKPTVALSLLKIDRVTIDGIRFTRRIYNAQQITSSGTAYISVKLERRHLAISAVNVLDSNQNQYYEWKKVRKYKSKNKTYNLSISVSPYSTVVVHTKSSKLKRADYSY